MDVEIRTLDGELWIASLDGDEAREAEPGGSARHVFEAIDGGRPVRVRESADRTGRPGRPRTLLMVFNPGAVVSVAEDERGRRPGRW